MARNRLSPFCVVFRGTDVDSIPLSKLGERETEPILDDEARQALTERTSTTRHDEGRANCVPQSPPGNPAQLLNCSMPGRDESKIDPH